MERNTKMFGGEKCTGGHARFRITGCCMILAVCALFFLYTPKVNAAGAAGEYYYTQLNTQEQDLYNQVKAQAGNLTDAYDPSNLKVSLSSPLDPDTEVGNVLFAFFRDHPEYFWINVSRIAFEPDVDWDDSNPSWHLSAMSGESYFYDGFTEDNLQGYRTQFDEAVDRIMGGAPSGDPVLMVRYLNNWLSIHNTYNVNGMGASNFSRCAASGILSENNAQTGPVCYGYATALKVLLDKAGVNNAFVEGTAYNDKNLPYGERHAWNYVEINGVWYALDPTWDDPGILNRPATEAYFLVGSGTETITGTLPTGMTEDMKRFGGNHIATPIGNYGLTYPALSEIAYPQRGGSDLQVILPDGTIQTETDFTSALNIAENNPGTTIRLWQTVTVSGTLVIPNQTTIDLNGLGNNTRNDPAIRGDSSPVFRIEAGETASVINSGETFSAIALPSGTYGAAVENNGTLTLGVGVTVIGGTVPAVSGNPAQAEQYGILPSTSASTQTVGRVVAPPSAEADEEYQEQDGVTVQTLLNNAGNGNYDPEIALTYWNGVQNITPVAGAQPEIVWRLASAPDGAGIDAGSPLENGRYTLQAVVKDTDSFYGYNVYRYIDVTVIRAEPPRHTFEVLPPAFSPVEYGYGQVSAGTLTITNTGNEEMTVLGVSAKNQDGTVSQSFTVQNSGSSNSPETVRPGQRSTSWSVSPVQGLGAGTYTAVIEVEVRFDISSTVTETAEVSMEVKPVAVPADSMTVSGGSGGAENVFIYGDTVSVEASFTIPAQAPDVPMALFVEDVSRSSSQISEPVYADTDGKYRFSVDTTEKKLPVGLSDLVVRCTDPDSDFSYGEARAGVSLQQRIVTAVLSGDAGKAYDGTAALPEDADLTLGFGQGEVLEQDGQTLGIQPGNIQFVSPDAGTTEVIAGKISLTGNDGEYYVLASDTVTTQVTGISPAEPSVNFADISLSEGKGLSDLASASVSDAQGNVVPGTFSWFTDSMFTNPVDMSETLSEGSYTFWYRFAPSSNNYSVVAGAVVIRVEGAESGTEPEPDRPEDTNENGNTAPSEPVSPGDANENGNAAPSEPAGTGGTNGNVNVVPSEPASTGAGGENGIDASPQTGVSDSGYIYILLMLISAGTAGALWKKQSK